jgi:hypothetical protein
MARDAHLQIRHLDTVPCPAKTLRDHEFLAPLGAPQDNCDVDDTASRS